MKEGAAINKSLLVLGMYLLSICVIAFDDMVLQVASSKYSLITRLRQEKLPPRKATGDALLVHPVRGVYPILLPL